MVNCGQPWGILVRRGAPLAPRQRRHGEKCERRDAVGRKLSDHDPKQGGLIRRKDGLRGAPALALLSEHLSRLALRAAGSKSRRGFKVFTLSLLRPSRD